MNYPSLESVNRADHVQICRWYRFLPSPGSSSIDDIEKELEIMLSIQSKLAEFGGFTPEISKMIGWGK